MFVDASALCAILLGEPDGAHFAERIRTATTKVTSPIAIFETVRAITRVKGETIEAASELVNLLLDRAGVGLIAIGAGESVEAVRALDRYGKGRHPARLNMGDCFAYACAKVHGQPLLYKGDDFAKTDIAAA